jgi:hypothetical protein
MSQLRSRKTTAYEGASVHCDYLAFNCGQHGIHHVIAPTAIACPLVLFSSVTVLPAAIICVSVPLFSFDYIQCHCGIKLYISLSILQEPRAVVGVRDNHCALLSHE